MGQGAAAGGGAGCQEKPFLEVHPVDGSHSLPAPSPPQAPGKADPWDGGWHGQGREGRAFQRDTWAALCSALGAPPGLTARLQVRAPEALRSLGQPWRGLLSFATLSTAGGQ